IDSDGIGGVVPHYELSDGALLHQGHDVIPEIVQRVGRRKGLEALVVFRGRNSLRTVHYHRPAFRTRLRFEHVPAEGIEEVQPLIPERLVAFALQSGAIKIQLRNRKSYIYSALKTPALGLRASVGK